ncbi:hypothetical protein ACFLRC_02035, partial [Candidatus Altiarchaeota archaeon]
MSSKKFLNSNIGGAYIALIILSLLIPFVVAEDILYPQEDGHCYDWTNPGDGVPDFCQLITDYALVGAYYNGGGPVRSVIEFPMAPYYQADSAELCVDHYHALYNGSHHDVYVDSYVGDGEVTVDDFYYPDNPAGTIFNAYSPLGEYCLDVTSNFNDAGGEDFFGLVLHWTPEVEVQEGLDGYPDYWYVHTVDTSSPPYLRINGGLTSTSSTSTSTTSSTSSTSTSSTSTSSTSTS